MNSLLFAITSIFIFLSVFCHTPYPSYICYQHNCHFSMPPSPAKPLTAPILSLIPYIRPSLFHIQISLLHWRWIRYIFSKLCCLSTNLYDVITQKYAVSSVTAVRTRNISWIKTVWKQLLWKIFGCLRFK